MLTCSPVRFRLPKVKTHPVTGLLSPRRIFYDSRKPPLGIGFLCLVLLMGERLLEDSELLPTLSWRHRILSAATPSINIPKYKTE